MNQKMVSDRERGEDQLLTEKMSTRIRTIFQEDNFTKEYKQQDV